MTDLTEQDTIKKIIIPRLTGNLSWKEEDFRYEKRSGGRPIDIVYYYEDKPLVVIEAKKPNIFTNEKASKALSEQAIPYARSLKCPIAIATDGSNFFKTWHIIHNQPLKDYENKEVDITNWKQCLRFSNLAFLKKSCNLSEQVKSRDELPVFYKKLNDYGKSFGITTGVERVVEIAKILFVKMLVDNRQHLDDTHWTNLVNSKTEDKLDTINHLLGKVNKRGIEVTPLSISDDKSSILSKMIDELNVINLNNKNYDVVGSLFESFLSTRASGRSNDLGQYFTPPML